jgi:hypothetical protein
MAAHPGIFRLVMEIMGTRDLGSSPRGTVPNRSNIPSLDGGPRWGRDGRRNGCAATRSAQLTETIMPWLVRN